MIVREQQVDAGAEQACSGERWSIVAAAFIAGFVVFGTIYCFGVFLESMAADLSAGRGATSALFSITGIAFYMLGPFTGRLSDRLGPRIVVGFGALLVGGGLVLTAYIDRIWVGYLTYGVGLGVGAACAYVPTLATVGGWFTRRRNTALGLAAAGTGCGMLIVPPLAAALIESYGWRTADVILGLGSGALLMVCAFIVRPAQMGSTPDAARPIGQVLRSRPFLSMYASWVLTTTALFVPFVLLPSHARAGGADQVAAAALLSLLGGMSVLGRVGIGPLSARIGTIPLFKWAVLTMAASFLLWLLLPGYGSLVAFAIVLGLAYGIRISLVPAVLIEFFGLQNQGLILGVFFTASGVASVLGPALAGDVVDATGSYNWGVAFALAMGLLGAIAIAPLGSRPGTDTPDHS
jgi:MFS family permease